MVINNPDISQIISLAKNFDDEAIQKLIRDYKKICLAVGYKYKIDLRSEVNFLMWKAIETYEEKRGKFSSWVWLTSFYYCMAVIRKSGPLQFYPNEIINTLKKHESYEDTHEEKGLFAEVNNSYLQKVLELTYRDGLTLHQIGKMLNLSHTTVSNHLKKGEKILKLNLSRFEHNKKNK